VRYFDDIDERKLSFDLGLDEQHVNELILLNSVAMEVNLGTKHYDEYGVLLETTQAVLEALWSGKKISVELNDPRFPNGKNFTMRIGE